LVLIAAGYVRDRVSSMAHGSEIRNVKT
jgi:hypothetical protein